MHATFFGYKMKARRSPGTISSTKIIWNMTVGSPDVLQRASREFRRFDRRLLGDNRFEPVHLVQIGETVRNLQNLTHVALYLSTAMRTYCVCCTRE